MTAQAPTPRAAPASATPDTTLATLREFGMCLLALVTIARSGNAQDMHREALQVLQGLIPFDSAWWGEVSPGSGETPPRNWLHGSIGLSLGFAQEWNALSAVDRFAGQSIAHCGEVLRASSDDGRHPPEGIVDSFCKRHGIEHAMAITMELPASGLMFFVSIYRRPGAPPFRDDEAVIFGEFARHLVQHWRDVLDGLQGAVPGRTWDAYAFADGEGRLIYLGARVGQVLHQAEPTWQGTMLPSAVAAQARQAPCTVTMGRSDRLALVPCGGLLALVLEDRGPGDPLAPRERRATTLYAQGRSYKEIAERLELSPATVRTYLRNVYASLGVRNKIELVSALGLAARDTP
jgi:DNA-binding CsgD family transcriptional regulator